MEVVMSIFTPKFELQIEKENSLLCIGCDSIKDAKKEIQWYFAHSKFRGEFTGRCYLWGNSASGRNYLNNRNADYYSIDPKTLNVEPCAIEIVY
jgi:hypothetical protein